MLADLTVLRPSRPQANMAESDFALREKHKTAGPSGEDRCEGTAVCRVLRPHLACVVVTCVIPLPSPRRHRLSWLTPCGSQVCEERGE